MKNQKNRKYRRISAALSIILCICVMIGSIQLTAYGQDEPEATDETTVELDSPEEQPAEAEPQEDEPQNDEPQNEEPEIEESTTEQKSDANIEGETPSEKSDTEIESDTETNTSTQTETETETDISTETDLEITTVIEPSDTEEIDEAVAYVQALIDALPSPDDITEENADEIIEKITEIDTAIGQLTDEQAAKLNKDAYFDVSEKLVEINRGGGQSIERLQLLLHILQKKVIVGKKLILMGMISKALSIRRTGMVQRVSMEN